MTPHRECLFDDREVLAHELARVIAEGLETALHERDRASLVVSGGSTPRPLFGALSRYPLEWKNVRVTLADERWVPVEHEASNERLVRRHLLVEQAAEAEMVGLYHGTPTPEEGLEGCEAALAKIRSPFDAVVLGMGDDGHTASLFPGTRELQAGLDRRTSRLCLAVNPEHATHARVSLTLAALLSSRRLIVHITGEKKWQVYRAALEDASQYPIRAVLAGGHPDLRIYWAP